MATGYAPNNTVVIVGKGAPTDALFLATPADGQQWVDEDTLISYLRVKGTWSNLSNGPAFFTSGKPWADPDGFAGTDDQKLAAAFAVGLPVFLGRFYTTTTPISLAFDGQEVFGTGMSTSGITNTTGDVFTWSANRRYLHFHDFAITASAGHMFNAAAFNTNFCQWERLKLTQTNTAKSFFRQTDGLYINNEVALCDLTLQSTHTVPGWDVTSTQNGINSNTWRRSQCTSSGNWVISINNTGTGRSVDNTVREFTFEQTTGGNVFARSVRNLRIEDCSTYDIASAPGGVTTKNLYDIGKSVSGLNSDICTFRNVWRHDGAPGGGLFDIARTGGAVSAQWVLEDCNGTCDGGTGISVTLLGAAADGGTLAVTNWTRIVQAGLPGLYTTDLNGGIFGLDAGGLGLIPGTGPGATGSLRTGTGAPANSLGSNGDYYLRTDGGANTHLYFKAAGAWSAVT